MTTHKEHGDKDHAQYASTQVRKYASTQVRKYASTQKTSAILIATLAGFLLGSLPVSASTNSERWVAPRPSAEDCRQTFNNLDFLSQRQSLWEFDNGSPLIGRFKDALSKSPELINCRTFGLSGEMTIAHLAVISYGPLLNVAKWALSKGIDLTIEGVNGNNWTAYEYAIYEAGNNYHAVNNTAIGRKWGITKENFLKLAEILKPPPAQATKSCAEVDGQSTLPDYFPDFPEIKPNEYCIVAENTQESFKARLVVPGFDGYEHKTTAVSSGLGFRKDWKSTITFTCRAPAGQSCEGLPYADDPLGPGIDADNFELYVRCGNTINLLDVDSIDGGKSETIDVIEVTNEYPYSRNCTAKSSQPFTLRIQTTRLAK